MRVVGRPSNKEGRSKSDNTRKPDGPKMLANSRWLSCKKYFTQLT